MKHRKNFFVTFNFRNDKAQCAYVSLYGELDERKVCCGSMCIKRKQSLSEEKAAEAPGCVVDLIAKKLEMFGLGLMLKRVKSESDKKFYLCADGDTQVRI